MFGPRGRRRALAGAGAGIGRLDLERSSAHDLDAVHEDRALQQLDPAPRADYFGLDLEWADRYGTEKLVGDASQAQPVRRRESLERPHQQRRRGAAVLGRSDPTARAQAE